MYGLNGISGAMSDFCWPAQLGKNMFDDGSHSPLISEHRIIRKGACYPFSGGAQIFPLCQIADMDEEAFDRDRIRAVMREKKKTQTAMAKVMGLPSQSAFSNIMLGKRRVTAEEAKRAYDFLGIKREPAIQWVPVIGLTNAGQWREAIHMPLGNLPVRAGSVSDDVFAIEVVGDSMDKLVPDGGHIIVDPRQKELRDGKAYLIQNSEGETTVKAYFRSPSRFEPVSNNPCHEGWLVSEQDFLVLGRVVLGVAPL